MASMGIGVRSLAGLPPKLLRPRNTVRQDPNVPASRAKYLMIVNVQPQLNCANGARPLARGLRYASTMLISSKFADGGQSGSLRLNHGSRGVRRWLLARKTFQQSPRFLIGANGGDLQDRSTITGFYEALLVAHSSALVECDVWQRRKVKVGHGQDAALVDGTIERAAIGLVPRGKLTHSVDTRSQSSDS
jgi:hypothetical protein